MEIEYILDTPFSMLSRKEVVVRKLLTKYHDDKEALQKSLAAVAYSFDPHLAERTRAKNPKGYTQEENSWASVDRVLHPELRQGRSQANCKSDLLLVDIFMCTTSCFQFFRLLVIRVYYLLFIIFARVVFTFLDLELLREPSRQFSRSARKGR